MFTLTWEPQNLTNGGPVPVLACGCGVRTFGRWDGLRWYWPEHFHTRYP